MNASLVKSRELLVIKGDPDGAFSCLAVTGNRHTEPVINNDRANALRQVRAPQLSIALHMPTTLSLTGRGNG